MTVQNLIVKNIYSGNGSNKSWPYTFACPEEHPEYIKVYIKDPEGNIHETEDFSVDISTKTVTYPVAGKVLSNEEKIVVARKLPLHQMLNLINQGPFFAEDIEVTLDELVMMLQQLNEKLERTLKFSIDVDQEDFDPSVPIAAGKSFRINNQGTGFEVTADPADVYNDTVAVFVNAANEAIAAQNAANVAQNAANVAKSAKDKVVEIAPNYQLAEQALLEIDRLAEETVVNASNATAASDSAIQALRDANLINNSGNADLLSAQNAVDIIEGKNLLTKELAYLKTFWNVYDKEYPFNYLEGYIRGKTVSYPGRITSSSTRRTFYFQVQKTCKMYAKSGAASVIVRVSDEEPKLGTSAAWDGILYTLNEINSELLAVDVQEGQYVAFCNSTGTSVSSTEIRLSYEAYALKESVGLTDTMRNEVNDIHNNNSDYLKYAIDNVLCIGDSLTAGSSYEMRDGSLHWLGNIRQNYPYFLSRMLNTTCVNGGDGGETTMSWYRKHFFQYNYADYNVVIIFLGTNGNFTDTIDEDVNIHSSYNDYAETNTGIYCKMIEQIMEANPDCQIIMVNYFSVATGSTEGRSVLPKIAAKYGLPIVSTDEMETDRGAIYHGNTGNVHLAKYGYLYLANKIANTIVKWFAEDLNRVNFGRNPK